MDKNSYNAMIVFYENLSKLNSNRLCALCHTSFLKIPQNLFSCLSSIPASTTLNQCSPLSSVLFVLFVVIFDICARCACCKWFFHLAHDNSISGLNVLYHHLHLFILWSMSNQWGKRNYLHVCTTWIICFYESIYFL